MAPAGWARRGRSRGATSRAAAALPAAVAAAPRRRGVARRHAARPAAAACGRASWSPAGTAGHQQPAQAGIASRGTTPRPCVLPARGAACGRCVRSCELVARRDGGPPTAGAGRHSKPWHDATALYGSHVSLAHGAASEQRGSGRGCPCPGSRPWRQAKPTTNPPAADRCPAKAQPARSERRAGCPQRTSGDGAWAAPTSVTREVRVGCALHAASTRRGRRTLCATRVRSGRMDRSSGRAAANLQEHALVVAAVDRPAGDAADEHPPG